MPKKASDSETNETPIRERIEHNHFRSTLFPATTPLAATLAALIPSSTHFPFLHLLVPALTSPCTYFFLHLLLPGPERVEQQRHLQHAATGIAGDEHTPVRAPQSGHDHVCIEEAQNTTPMASALVLMSPSEWP